MNWNRVYRPKKIADLHLTTVRDYFLSLMKAGTFPQVFLFTGSKGTGKTSTARIIAAMLNDPKNESVVKKTFFEKEKNTKSLTEPTGESELAQRIFSGSSYVVHELDAASNRGIDDVRALKERIALPPQEGLISVYILDEVHMLTTEAFNALLKILEEPPPHVVFILATTELDKIPATIVSRAQVIRFSKASTDELLVAVKNIVKSEKLVADDEVLLAIAKRAEGSFRDAVKLLEMIAQVGPITKDSAENVLNLSLSNQVVTLVEKLISKDARGVVETFQQLRSTQTDSKQLHIQLLTYLHQDLLRSLGVTDGAAVFPTKTSQFLLKELAETALSGASPIPLLLLELKFLEIIERSQKKPTPPGSSEPSAPPAARKVESKTRVEEISTRKIATEEITAAPDFPEEEIITEMISVIPEKVQMDVVPTGGAMGNGQTICDRWQDVIAEAVKSNFSLATLLKASRPLGGETGKVKISVYYQFHKEQLMQPRFIKLLDTLFQDFAGGKVQLECVLIKEPATAELSQPSEAKKLADLAVSSLM